MFKWLEHLFKKELSIEESSLIKDNKVRAAAVQNIVDGDTIDLSVHLLDTVIKYEWRFRIHGINCPEKTGLTKEEGLRAKKFVEDKISGAIVDIQFRDKQMIDGFRRWIVDIYYTDENGKQHSLAKELLANGLAVVFMEDK